MFGTTDPFFILKKVPDLVERVYVEYAKDTLDPFLPAIEIILKLLTFVFAVSIVVVLVRLHKVNTVEDEKYAFIEPEGAGGEPHNIRWQVVLNHAASENPAEWKIAIIEADAILDELLQDAGYPGETMADRLKAAGQSETIEQAWEAHKARNRIAHEGGLELSRREVDTTIALYESVFKRMGFL